MQSDLTNSAVFYVTVSYLCIVYEKCCDTNF